MFQNKKPFFLEDHFKIKPRTELRKGFSNQRFHFKIVLSDLLDSKYFNAHVIIVINWNHVVDLTLYVSDYKSEKSPGCNGHGKGRDQACKNFYPDCWQKSMSVRSTFLIIVFYTFFRKKSNVVCSVFQRGQSELDDEVNADRIHRPIRGGLFGGNRHVNVSDFIEFDFLFCDLIRQNFVK